MKTRFNSYDIICMVSELQRLIGMRVNQVYDIDNKTYVIRLQRSEEKAVLLLESGSRFHTTQFEWPKNVAPSGFTMKLRKHLKNKRLEKLVQLGVDRIVDLQFGSNEAAYHVIMELYDRGNIILADHELTILYLLRPHVEQDKIRFAVKEKYPLDRVKTSYEVPTDDVLKDILINAKPGDTLKKILNPKLEFGSAVIDHVLLVNGLAGNMKVSKDPNKGFEIERDFEKLVGALKLAEHLFENVNARTVQGFIVQKKEEWPDSEGSNYMLANQEFHPMLFAQFKSHPHSEHETFDRAVDEFFSALEGQKIDLKTLQIEREAMKKLANVRKDHEKRVSALQSVQVMDRRAAEMISRNDSLVERARLAVQTGLANQMSWDDIKFMVKTAQDNKDPVALAIKQLKLNTNHITLLLKDPYHDLGEPDEDAEDRLDPMLVDIDLSLSAFANARRYYDQKRNAAKKQQKTLESAGKALKSAERKTKQTLKEANTISNITKARKTYWFEKFFWFISSDNYLVIAGRDQQQNEMLVKRYMRSSDIYVHAEVAGASSVIVKNPSKEPVPPRTLSEAGQAAVAYSVSWEAKVLTRAWWVHAHQVSKSAPTGEYLTTGSFMIRGRKNYLLPDQLQFGFSFLFRLEDGCIERHRGERKALAIAENTLSDVSSLQDQEQDMVELEILISDDEDGNDDPSEKEESSNGSSHRGMETIAEEHSMYTSDRTDNIVENGDDTEVEPVKTENTEPTEGNESKLGKQQKEKQNKEKKEGKIPRKKTSQDSNTAIIAQESDDSEKEVKEDKVTDGQDAEEKELNADKKDDLKTDKDDSNSDSDDEEGVLHTHIKIDHETGKVFTKTRTTSEMSDKRTPEEEKLMSFPALPKKGGKKPNRNGDKKKESPKQEKMAEKEAGIKRGQKSKLKKMKEKYKDQDEEQRAFMLELLKPGKPEKESKKAEKAAKKAKLNKGGARQGPKIPAPAPLILELDSDAELEPDAEAEAEAEAGADPGTDMLAQLTGCPRDEDELLFAVPVVAPYSALLNYKYKVKLLPGTSKRGKAAKTAVQVFLRDRECTAREKDLLKAVKEENIARNFPGKVKLTAPQLHKHKK